MAQPYLYERLKDRLRTLNTAKVQQRQRLISVTGQELKFIAGCELPLKVNGSEITVPLLFSEAPIGVYCDGILGNDSLMRHGIDVVGGRQLRIG